MRQWLLYEIIKTDAEGTHVRFFRPNRLPLTPMLAVTHIFANPDNLRKQIERLVSASDWVGDTPRDANSEIGRMVCPSPKRKDR